MAREYAKIRLSRQHDDSWCDLSPGAQHLYDTLTTSEDMSYCGRVDWRPARLLPRARGWTLPQITAEAAELEIARYVLFDPDTEEALVRALIRSDELLRNPKMGISVVKAYGALASRTLRAAVVSELRRAREEQPEFSAWTHSMCAPQLERLLSLPDLESVGYTNRITNAIGNSEQGAAWLVSVPQAVPAVADPGPGEGRSITNPIANQIPNGNANGIGYADPVPNTNADRSESPIPTQVRNTSVIGNPDRSVSYQQTADSRQQTSGGDVTGERHQRDPLAPPNDPPPKFHPGHEGEYDPDCDRCTQTAAAREAWLISRAVVEAPEPALGCDRHPNGTDTACRPCQAARKTHEQWKADRDARRRVAAEHKRDEITHCDLCDEAGWRKPPPQLADADPPVVRCTHQAGMPGAWRDLIAELLAEAATPEGTKSDV